MTHYRIASDMTVRHIELVPDPKPLVRFDEFFTHHAGHVYEVHSYNVNVDTVSGWADVEIIGRRVSKAGAYMSGETRIYNTDIEEDVRTYVEGI